MTQVVPGSPPASSFCCWPRGVAAPWP